MTEKKRIDIIDALRGFSVLLMVVHHLLYDLVTFLDAPDWLFSNPVFDVLHYIFAGLFIFLSGVSSQLSRSNIKRGLKVIGVALAITLVTSLPIVDMPIRFGILHLLGLCMVFYGLTRRMWDKIPLAVAPFLYAVLTVAGALAPAMIEADTPLLWIFGWARADFSADYFPVLPWIFVFLAGTWAGFFVAREKLPRWFYETRVAFFPAIGRRALLIYILHQPIIYGAVMAVSYLKERVA